MTRGEEVTAFVERQVPEVYFYVPSSRLVEGVPASIADYWRWIDEVTQTSPAKLANRLVNGQGNCTWVGPYNWTVQTFIYLRDSGFPCALTASLPEEGVIITHSDFIPANVKPSSRQFIVEIKPDRFLQSIYSNFVIVQNRHDPIRHGLKRLLIRSAFVNYWPQPGLIPRSPMRGDRFENICYMGNPEQFVREGELLEREVAGLGLRWRMMPRDSWHDYSETDAVVALRPQVPAVPGRNADRKPASKLYNAWLAGVPAVLSPDPAFRDLRRSTLDYLEASSVPEVVLRLTQLRDDAGLRRAMTDNGRRRAGDFCAERAVKTWTDIIQNEIIPRYNSWSKSPLRRKWLELSRRALHRVSSHW